MKRKRVFRDQRWLIENIKKKRVERGVIETQLNYNNIWVKPGRAKRDLSDAYDNLSISCSVNKMNARNLIYIMSVWLRQNRRLVPSNATFRRFLLNKSNT